MKQKSRSPRRTRIEKSVISEREFEALMNTPQYYGEESFSGRMPHPEADDDTLKSIQEYGFYTEIDTPEGEEMDLQKQLDQAERARRRRRDNG
ncbi:MAG TPA: hypothetical protein VMW04_03735 [Patescibacteria group bacterium]|nr:hypothetical protein [Patescibacteria group bacterium]